VEPSGYLHESIIFASIKLVHINSNISGLVGESVPLGQPQTSWKIDAAVVGMNRGSQKSAELDVWRFLLLAL